MVFHVEFIEAFILGRFSVSIARAHTSRGCTTFADGAQDELGRGRCKSRGRLIGGDFLADLHRLATLTPSPVPERFRMPVVGHATAVHLIQGAPIRVHIVIHSLADEPILMVFHVEFIEAFMLGRFLVSIARAHTTRGCTTIADAAHDVLGRGSNRNRLTIRGGRRCRAFCGVRELRGPIVRRIVVCAAYHHVAAT